MGGRSLAACARTVAPVPLRVIVHGAMRAACTTTSGSSAAVWRASSPPDCAPVAEWPTSARASRKGRRRTWWGCPTSIGDWPTGRSGSCRSGRVRGRRAVRNPNGRSASTRPRPSRPWPTGSAGCGSRGRLGTGPLTRAPGRAGPVRVPGRPVHGRPSTVGAVRLPARPRARHRDRAGLAARPRLVERRRVHGLRLRGRRHRPRWGVRPGQRHGAPTAPAPHPGGPADAGPSSSTWPASSTSTIDCCGRSPPRPRRRGCAVAALGSAVRGPADGVAAGAVAGRSSERNGAQG